MSRITFSGQGGGLRRTHVCGGKQHFNRLIDELKMHYATLELKDQKEFNKLASFITNYHCDFTAVYYDKKSFIAGMRLHAKKCPWTAENLKELIEKPWAVYNHTSPKAIEGGWDGHNNVNNNAIIQQLQFPAEIPRELIEAAFVAPPDEPLPEILQEFVEEVRRGQEIIQRRRWNRRDEDSSVVSDLTGGSSSVGGGSSRVGGGGRGRPPGTKTFSFDLPPPITEEQAQKLNPSQIYRIILDGCLKVVAEAERGAREARDEVESVNDAYESFLKGQVSFVIYSIYFSPYLVCFRFIFFPENCVWQIQILLPRRMYDQDRSAEVLLFGKCNDLSLLLISS